jgi:hypothetical protein
MKREFKTMKSIKLRRHIGQDGILHLDIPVGLVERELEVMVIYQPVLVSCENLLTPVWRSLENLYGICADDPIILDDSEILESQDHDLIGIFHNEFGIV